MGGQLTTIAACAYISCSCRKAADFHSVAPVPGVDALWGRTAMPKKAAAKGKRSTSKLKENKHVTKSHAKARAAQPKRPAAPRPEDDPRFAQAVQNYEAGLKAMQERKFERAKGLFQKVTASGLAQLADRAAVHLSACNQQLAGDSSVTFKSPEEHFDFAVSLINAGEFEEARAHLEKILKQNSKADYAVYGMASLSCITGKFEDALRYLSEAIRLNPGNRFQARNDSDFQNLADDPRFTELLYPENDFNGPPR
jgi:tetratricopeptide (TPR) repeat protein